MSRTAGCAAVVLCAGLAAAAGQEARTGIAIHSADHGWTGGVVWWAERAAADWAKKDPGAKFDIVTAATPSEQAGQMENHLQKHRKIDAVLAKHDDVLKGALLAYKESGRKDIRFFIGGAGNKDIVSESVF